MAASKQDLAKLRDPLPPAAIEWRAQSSGASSGGKPWVKVLAYVTNRAVMDRLDDVVGADAWRNEYHAGPDGGVVCGLSIRVAHADGTTEWLTRWDGADNTDVEAVKGGLSAAMKRAAVQWGIGRYLYELEEGWGVIGPNGAHSAKMKDGSWVKWDPPQLPAWALPGGSGHPDVDARPAPRRADTPDAVRSVVGMPPKPTPERAAAVLALPDPYPDELAGFAPIADEDTTQAVDERDPDCPKCGGATWDNRLTKRNPKAPDFKCRDKSCDGVIWPPKPGELPAGSAAQRRATAAAH